MFRTIVTNGAILLSIVCSMGLIPQMLISLGLLSGSIDSNVLIFIIPIVLFLIFIPVWYFQNRIRSKKLFPIIGVSFMMLVVDFSFSKLGDFSFVEQIINSLLIVVFIYWLLRKLSFKNRREKYLTSVSCGLFVILFYAFWGLFSEIIFSSSLNLIGVINSLFMFLPKGFTFLIIYLPVVVLFSVVFSQLGNVTNKASDEILDSDY